MAQATTPALRNYEKAFTCNSPDLIAGLGANETVTQGRGRANGQLCADRQDRRRKLVYSMKCENLPVPPPAPPQAETREAPAPEPEVQRGGIFGWSYERKKPGE